MSARGWSGGVVVGLVLVLAACGGGSEASSSSGGGTRPAAAPASGASSTTEAESESEPESESGSGTASRGAIACDELDDAAEQLASVEYLLLLDTPDHARAIKTNLVGDLDLTEFLTAMRTLHQLDPYGGPLGDPRTAIETYEAAALAARDLFAVEPITQAAINVYQDSLGDPAAFLSQQTAITGALAEAGC